MTRPYRLGTTSFIYREAALPNVRKLAPLVDDIEILFFDVSDPEGLPDTGDLRAMAALKAAHDLTYSLHTPLDASLASRDERRRQEGVAAVLKSIELASPLEPERFILHVYLGDREGEVMPDSVEAWRRRATRSLEAILASGLAPDRLCLEWLDYDLSLLDPVLDELGLSVALDIGHLYRDRIELDPVIDSWLSRSSVLHWHGTAEKGRDHVSLEHFPEAEGRRLLRRLHETGWDGVLTVEVFNELDFEQSLNRIEYLSSEASTCPV